MWLWKTKGIEAPLIALTAVPRAAWRLCRPLRVGATLTLGALPILKQPAFAASDNPRSAAMLYQACLAETGRAPSWCEAYLIGAADMLLVFGNGGRKGGICGAEYTPELLKKIYLKWVRENPDLARFDMTAGVVLALRARWPCR
jgi:hypothetical protein